MSTHTTTLSNLGDTLIMIWGFKANIISLKRCESFKIPLIISEVMTFNLLKYGSPTIFIYNLDLGRWGLSMESRFIFWTFFKYFLIVNKSRLLAGLFVMMMILLMLNWMKSAKVSDLEFFKHVMGYLDTNNFYFILFYFSDFTFLLFYFIFLLEDDEEGTWQGSHITGHMM